MNARESKIFQYFRNELEDLINSNDPIVEGCLENHELHTDPNELLKDFDFTFQGLYHKYQVRVKKHTIIVILHGTDEHPTENYQFDLDTEKGEWY